MADLGASLQDHEPSDWLMIVDPRCFPSVGFDPGALLLDLEHSPRRARHLVALDAHPEGTAECVQLDPSGTVRRIQRYYDLATWVFASGVSCSLLPIACTLGGGDMPFGSLRELRRSLVDRGVPSHDVTLGGGAFDLSEEGGLLGLSERTVLGLFESRRASDDGWRVVGPGCQLHPSARLVGPVIIQQGVTIGPDAVIVGPAVLGEGVRIGRDAMVAQCVVGPGMVVAPGTTVRHRVLVAGAETAPPAPRPFYVPSPLPRNPAETMGGRSRSRGYPALKVAIDLFAAAAGLLLLSPFLVLTALLIRLESRGPIFFRDRREGRGGRVFECFKFRTMFVGADLMQRELLEKNQVDGPQFKLVSDPRVTHVGRLVRALSLDELPQLLNVLRLEMSLVGPRPSPFRENQLCIPWRDGRLSVRPGITGLWQICRHRRSQGDFHQWIQYDLLYVRHMSLLVDLRILVATVLTLGGQWPVPLARIIPHAGREALR